MVSIIVKLPTEILFIANLVLCYKIRSQLYQIYYKVVQKCFHQVKLRKISSHISITFGPPANNQQQTVNNKINDFIKNVQVDDIDKPELWMYNIWKKAKAG